MSWSGKRDAHVSKPITPYGDYFVIHSSDGRYWTGQEWTTKRADARRYAGRRDAYTLAAEEAATLLSAGTPCAVLHFPRRTRANRRR